MLTCKEVTELVTDYLEGQMSFVRRVSFHLHLGMCRHCRAYLRQMKMTLRTLGKLAGEPMPINVRDEIAKRLRHMRPASQAAPIRRPIATGDLDAWLAGARGWTIVAASLLIALLFGILHGGEPGPLVGAWQYCLSMELGGAMVPITVMLTAAGWTRARVSAGTLAALATGGALVGYFALVFLCPASRVTSHVLIVHVDGIVLAAILGAAASRLVARP